MLIIYLRIIVYAKGFNSEGDILDDLLKYCELDTLTMVRVFEELKKFIEQES